MEKTQNVCRKNRLESDTLKCDSLGSLSVEEPQEIKPLLRGRIHQIAFVQTILLLFGFIFLSYKYKFVIGVLIYLISQLLLYGISSTYHTHKWQSKTMRRLFQRLDHLSIFLLISGTQTSVFLTCIGDIKKSIAALITTWVISTIGIAKVLIFNTIVEILDVAIYIVHGVSVIPFFNILIKHLRAEYIYLFISGGVFYIIGGIIFGLQYPDPFPRFFGYHEVFHLLTVLANICFMIPIFSQYLNILYDS